MRSTALLAVLCCCLRAQPGSPTYTVTTLAGGNHLADDGPATSALLNEPHAMAIDREGNWYVTDRNNHRVLKISAQGVATTIAGNECQGSLETGDRSGGAPEHSVGHRC